MSTLADPAVHPRSRVPDLRSQVPDVRSRVADVRSRVLDPRTLIGLAAAVVVPALLISQRHLLGASLRSLRHLDLAALASAAAAGAASMVALAAMHRRLLQAAGARLSLARVTSIVYASNAISASVPLAGSELGTAYSYGQYQRRGLDKVTTVWVLGLSGVVSSATFAVVISGAALVSGSLLATLSGVAGSAVAVGGTVLVLVGVRRQQPWVVRLAMGGVRAVQRGTRGPHREPEALVSEALGQLAGLRLGGPDWVTVLGGAALNWIADIACLALAVHATGLRAHWTVLVLAWSAAASASSLGLTPGGIGLVEAAATAVLVGYGQPAGRAMAGVLVYRLVSFWLPVMAGWASYLAQRHGVPMTLRRQAAGVR